MIFIKANPRCFKRLNSESGIIVLYNIFDVKLACMRYSRPSNRVKIMLQWIEVYGEEKMKTFYVHIIPDIKL